MSSLPTATIAKCSGAFSLFGSLWIISAVLRDKRKQRMPYQRIVLGLSTFDAASSFFYATVDWYRDPGVPGPACTASGFFTYLGYLSVPLYNAVLALYFMITVRYGWTDERVIRDFEQYVHPMIAVFGLTICVVAIPLEIYNPFHLVCYPFNSFPPFQRARDVYFIISIAVTISSALFVTAIMVLLCGHIRAVLKRSQRFTFEASIRANSDQVPQALSETISSDLPREERRAGVRLSAASSSPRRINLRTSSMRTPKRKMAQRVYIMAFLYTIPFYMTWVIPTVYYIIMTLVYRGKVSFFPSQRAQDAMQVYIATIMPLQGFFNWCIYMIPTFQSIQIHQLSTNLSAFFGSSLFSRRSPENDDEVDTSGSGERAVEEIDRSCMFVQILTDVDGNKEATSKSKDPKYPNDEAPLQTSPADCNGGMDGSFYVEDILFGKDESVQRVSGSESNSDLECNATGVPSMRESSNESSNPDSDEGQIYRV